jgi:hypothetical protein
MKKLIAVGLLGLSLALAPADAFGREVSAASGRVAGNSRSRSWTVWYQRPGQRWTGRSGLSYRDACLLRDEYEQKDWLAYVAPSRYSYLPSPRPRRRR